MENSNLKKYINIDFLKIAAMAAVLLYHCMLFYADNPFWFVRAENTDRIAELLAKLLDNSVIAVFVFCSGFGFCSSCEKRDLSTGNLILKRIRRLLVPWFFYGIFYLVPLYTAFDVSTWGRMSGDSLAAGYISFLKGDFADLAWFLLMLFWVNLIWILLRSLLKRDRISAGFLSAVAIYLICHFFTQNMWYKLGQIDVYVVIFFFGAAVYHHVDKLYSLRTTALGLLSAFLFAFATVITYGSGLPFFFTLIAKVLYACFFFIISIILDKNGIIESLSRTKVYQWLKLHSMHIYLFQAPWFYIIFRSIYPYVGNAAWVCIFMNFVLTACIVFVISEAITFCMRWFNERHE